MNIIKQSQEILPSGLELINQIENAGRLAYKSEDKITEGSAEKFVTGIIKRGHWPVLDMGCIHLQLLLSDKKLKEFYAYQKWADGKYLFFDVIGKDTYMNVCILSGSPRALTEYINKRSHIYTVFFQLSCFLYELDSICFSGLFRTKGAPPMKSEIIPLSVAELDRMHNTHMSNSIYKRHRHLGVKFITNRVITHELVRHRPCGFIQECIGKDELVQSFAGKRKWSMEQLYKIFQEPQYGNARASIRIRTKNIYNEIVPSQIIAVTKSGKKELFKVTTKNKRSLKTSKHHIYITEHGEVQLQNLNVGDLIWVNDNSCNNVRENLEFCCIPCHHARHSPGVKIAFLDEIISIEPCGIGMTYDIEVDHIEHNFAVNGIIVHNSQRYCRYDSTGSDKQGVTFIAPTAFFQEGAEDVEMSREWSDWYRAMCDAEMRYLSLLDGGASAQAARTVLPNSCKTEIIIFTNLKEWNHIFSLRTSSAAEPSMQEAMKPVCEQVKELFPCMDTNPKAYNYDTY